jgi:hypothetical protein
VDTIKLYLKEAKYEVCEWIQLAKYVARSRVGVTRMVNLRVSLSYTSPKFGGQSIRYAESVVVVTK